MNANNTAAQAAYAASAAAGAVYAGGLMAVAAGAAATTGWTGYGLIAAAVLAAIALILDQVISPAGPSLAVGDFKGLNIGMENGLLTVQGAVESEIQKSEGIGKEAAGEVQSALEASLMASTQALDALKQLNEQMYALFLSSTAIEQALGVITPTAAQRGEHAGAGLRWTRAGHVRAGRRGVSPAHECRAIARAGLVQSGLAPVCVRWGSAGLG